MLSYVTLLIILCYAKEVYNYAVCCAYKFVSDVQATFPLIQGREHRHVVSMDFSKVIVASPSLSRVLSYVTLLTIILCYAKEVYNYTACCAYKFVSAVQATFPLIQGREYCRWISGHCGQPSQQLHGLLQLMALKSSARFIAAAQGP